ncbi:MAG: peptidylprolyl isomerase [Acidimicrobiales bacterium]
MTSRPATGRRAVLVAVLALTAVLAAGCSGSSSSTASTSTTRPTASTTPPPPAGVALQVNDWQLPRATLDDWLAQVRANKLYLGSWQAANGVSPLQEGTDQLTADFVASFLNEQLSFQVAQQLLTQRNVTPSDADRAEATRRLGEGVAAGVGAGAGSATAPTPEEAQRLGEQLLAGFGSYGPVVRDGVASFIALRNALGGADREQALRTLYEQNKEGLTEVCASHVLVASSAADGGAGDAGATGTTLASRDAAAARARAEEAKAKLDAGVPFADVVAEYSDDPATKDKGGDLGCVSIGQYAQAFADAVRTAPIGQVIGPVTTPYGEHLIVVRSRRDPTFEEVRDRLARAYDQGGSDALVRALEEAMRASRLLIDPTLGLWDPDRATIVAPDAAGTPKLELSPAPEGSLPTSGGPARSVPAGGLPTVPSSAPG